MSVEYKIGPEIHELFEKVGALKSLIELIAPLPFTYRKCVKAAREKVILNKRAWEMVGKMYPDTIDKKMYYKYNTKTIKMGEVES